MLSDSAVSLAGKTSIKQTFRIIGKCRILIGNDSGPMHIGAAMGTPTIGLFGPNLPVRWRPFGKKNRYVYKPIKCSPCINVHLGKVPECRYGKDNRCMKLIEVKDVMEAVDSIIEEIYRKKWTEG